MPASPTQPGPREPAFNAPWPALVLIAALVLCFLGQGFLSASAVESLVLSPLALQQGRWWVLVSHLFLHAGWMHLAFNCLSVLAFAAPVARHFGTRALGGLMFFAFYSVCGVLAGLAFVALHLHGADGAVGASGAISGLMGAASRLIDRPGRLSPILTRSVYGVGGAWIALNLVMAVTGVAPGLDGARIAWEAHIAGYLAGLLLIGVFARLLPRPLSEA